MPIHGHTKIELTNKTTGAVETIEKDNIVTDAVADIINSFNGMMDLRKLAYDGEFGYSTNWQMLQSLYGGILLFDTAIGGDAGTLFAPPEAHVIASAAPSASNTGSSAARGSYNQLESKIDLNNGTVTFVSDFATSQANGSIASVCLTSRLGGFFGEATSKVTGRDGSNNARCMTSALWGTDSLFPGAAGQTDAHLYGRALYADPEADEVVFASLSGNNLLLRHCAAHTKTLDLFETIHKAAVKSVDTLDLTGFLQVTGSSAYSYAAPGYDADADKIYVVATSSSTVSTTGTIKVRVYDRKSLQAADYSFKNPTGVSLSGSVGGDRPALRPYGRVLGGNLYMRAASGGQIYKIPLSDPSKVTAIEMHGLTMPQFHDAHDGRIYYYGSKNNTYGAVLNTAKNEVLGIEACYDGDDYPPYAVPIVGEKAAIFNQRYSGSSGSSNESTVNRGIRRNYLATINDLGSAVEKTADQTMKITYTLRKES